MAYRSPTEVDQVFEAYLSGASFGNVVIEESFGIADPVQRWRLVCKKCGATLTYSDVSSAIMAEKYRFESILDDKVSKFCKAHCHQVKHETAKMYDLTAAEAKAKFDALPVKKPLPIQIVKLVPAPIKVPEPVLPAPLPMKKLGRRIR